MNRFLAIALTVLIPSLAQAQEIEWTATVVGFSKDGKVALVRWQEHFMDGSADAIAVARLDLATGKVLKKHDVVSRTDIEEAEKKAGEPVDDKAMAKLRGTRWSQLEKQLEKEGFTVEPKYKPAERSGPEIGHARFALPGSISLVEACVTDEESGMETCDLVAERGGKKVVLVKALYDQQMPSPLLMNFVRSAYVDPKSKGVITIDRYTTLGSKVSSKPDDLANGLRVFPLATIAP